MKLKRGSGPVGRSLLLLLLLAVVVSLLPGAAIASDVDSGYTVDFHYNGLTYSMEGGSSVLLSEVLDELAIERSAADAVSVAFSTPELVLVEQITLGGGGN